MPVDSFTPVAHISVEPGTAVIADSIASDAVSGTARASPSRRSA